jgi:hypothetical protein
VVEQADARDSKSRGPRGRAGSTPAFGTISFKYYVIKSWLSHVYYLTVYATLVIVIVKHSYTALTMRRRPVVGA